MSNCFANDSYLLVYNIISVVLVENGRLDLTDSVIEKFNEILMAHRGEVQCSVKSAKPLDKSMEQEISNVLKGFLKSNQKLSVVFEVNFDLLILFVYNNK